MRNVESSGPGTCNFAQVLQDEITEIKHQCGERGVADDLRFDEKPPGYGPDMLGVAFSGGGIRSACVGMGVLQRLARAGILRQTHYISGISGGGYLLGWLTAWTKRTGCLRKVEAQLGPNKEGTEPKDPSAFDRFVEPMPIHYLRRYSSYLTPRLGLLSGDTLAMISVYLRNLFLNQLLLISALICLTLVLQVFSPAILWQHTLRKALLPWGVASYLILFGVGVGYAGRALTRIGHDQNPKEPLVFSRISIGCGLLACMLLWLLLPSWFVANLSGVIAWLPVIGLALAAAVLCFSLPSSALGAPGSTTSKDYLQPVTQSGGASVIRWYVAAGLVVVAVLIAVHLGFQQWLSGPPGQVQVSDFYVVFGMPTLLVALTLESYLFIGVLGTALPDGKREWLARAAGYFLLFAGVISVLLAIALWGPLAMHLLFSGFDQASWRKYVTIAVLPGGWLFVVATGLIGANSAKSSGNASQPHKFDGIVAIAPPVFLVGLLLIVSWGTHALVRHFNREYLTWASWTPTPSSPSAVNSSPSAVQWSPSTIEKQQASASIKADAANPSSKSAWINYSAHINYMELFAVFLLIAIALGRRLDVNEFSMHLFYRNRLARAFLGASQIPPASRLPSPFTGFAQKDDFALRDLTMDSEFQGPYPIWGTTLNLTVGEDLALQQRKGASFIYSPLYCGWDYVDSKKMPKAEPEEPDFDADVKTSGSKQPVEPGKSLYGFRATCKKVRADDATPGKPARKVINFSDDYGGKPYIGTAMAASGAAVSPNSGYHTRPGVAALLAIFNLRLGWWTGNPRNRLTWKEYAPAIWYLLFELMGWSDDKAGYVYLSDGGHFENLGLYELVRRRVRFILCSDADADPNFAFQDLGNAIDKCRRDFGVEIHLRAQRDIAAEGGKGFRGGHYAIGEIVYPGQAKGCLLYIKSSLTNDEPSDVLGMKAQDAAFPHDTTANQFFNESMFESYRALGEHMLDVIFAQFGVENHPKDSAESVRNLFHALVKQGDDQKIRDGLPKPKPVAVAVTGGVSVQVSS